MQLSRRAWIAIGVVFFFLVVIWEFPYDRLKDLALEKIYAQTQIAVTAKSMRPSFFFWPGLKFYEVTVTLPQAMGGITFSTKKLVAKLGVGGLFPPRLKYMMTVSGLSGGGDLYIAVSDSKSILSYAIDADAIQLEQFEAPTGPYAFGTFSASGSMSISKVSPSASSGKLNAEVEKFLVPAVNFQYAAIPRLDLGKLDVELAIQNGTAEVRKFAFQGDQTALKGGLSGDIRLGRTWRDSQVSLTMRVTTSDELAKDPDSATLMSLLKTYATPTPNEYAMKWEATVGEMQSNPFSALPKKLLH